MTAGPEAARPDAQIPSAEVRLDITGMTCASCANRIERKLNKLDGVHASVNYATEAATVRYDPAVVDTDRLLDTVAAAGYSAALPAPPADDEPTPADPDGALRQRLLVSTLLTVPVLVLSTVPPPRRRSPRPRPPSPDSFVPDPTPGEEPCRPSTSPSPA